MPVDELAPRVTAAQLREAERRDERRAHDERRVWLASLTIPELVRELSPEFGWDLEHLAPWVRMFVRVDQGETVLGVCAVAILADYTLPT